MLSQRKGSVHLMFIVSLKHDSCERVKGTIAVPLTIPAPGGKIVAVRFIRLMPSACRGGAEPASLQAVPSARIPAGRPGQPSTPHRFSAGPGSSLQRTDFQLTLFCCSDKKRRWSGVGWSG